MSCVFYLVGKISEAGNKKTARARHPQAAKERMA